MSSSTSTLAPESRDEALQLVLRRSELAARIAQHAPVDGVHDTAIPQLQLARTSHEMLPMRTLYKPAFCLLAQGRKRVLLNEEPMTYDALHYLAVSHQLPVSGQVIEATPATPYLGLKLDIEPKDIAALLLEIGTPRPPPPGAARGIFTGRIDAVLLDAVLRLLRLLETPQDIPALAPLVMREILYRLLSCDEGWRLAQIGTPDSQSQRISRAIAWLQERFDQPLKIEAMASAVNMSASSLHHHFKQVTAMSPLQYQKQLRLQEARRLLLAGSVDAGTAGHRVGYESASQFSREYARCFGAPPARDIRRLRQQP